MDQAESEFLKTQQHQPLVWFRYVDDIFFIWTHGQEKLEGFLDNFNKFHPNLRFNHEHSRKHVTFLDLDVKIIDHKILTDLHIKATDRNQYLHYTSSHPYHTKRSIVYSQALRVSRIFSFENDFIRHRNEMKSWFLNRGYPKTLLDTDVKKVKFCNTSGDKKTKTNRILLVITYHPLLKDFAKVIKKHLHLLHMKDEVKKAFTPGPMVSFRGARKLSSYLVRAKLYPLERSVGSFKCNGKRCQVCINVTESNTFSSSVDKKEYVINHSFNCNDKCIIYLLTCNKCKMQYVGKTVDDFRLRWNNYKDNTRKSLRKEACMRQHLFEHFSSEGYSSFLDDISIIFIDKTDPKDPNKREHYWRHTLKAMAPQGLNVEND